MDHSVDDHKQNVCAAQVCVCVCVKVVILQVINDSFHYAGRVRNKYSGFQCDGERSFKIKP